MEVVSAEFLPFEGQLYILIIDADLDMHVLQYDPERAYTSKFLYCPHANLYRPQISVRPTSTA